MDRREIGFLIASAGAGLQFFGAIVGQGMLGDGMLWGLAGRDSVDLGALVGILAGAVSLVAAVALAFRRGLRPLVVTLGLAGLAGTLAAGPVFAVGAAIALAGGFVALSGSGARAAG